MGVEDLTDLPETKKQVKRLKEFCENHKDVHCKIGISLHISSEDLNLDINASAKAVMVYRGFNADPHGIINYLKEQGYDFYFES